MSYVIGTIYKIYYKLDPTIQYVGSTYYTLTERFDSHLRSYKKYLNGIERGASIYAYFMYFGVDNFEIEKIKDYLVYREDGKDHKHINAYEQLWINKLKCVNIYAAFNPLVKDKRYNAIIDTEKRLKKIANETEQEKAERLEKNRTKYVEKMENETEEQKKERNKIRREKRQNKTEQEKAEELEKNRKKYAEKTEEEKEAILEKERKRYAEKMENETEEEKKARKKKRSEDEAKKRANETAEETAERKRKKKERDAIYRAKKKAEKEAQKNLMANAELKTI